MTDRAWHEPWTPPGAPTPPPSDAEQYIEVCRRRLMQYTGRQQPKLKFLTKAEREAITRGTVTVNFP